ncbi:hypothetical protein M406DRAFT_66814 [Cryphonectria parasitica EP155]|uniref:prephenate dehydratase n=1 Tax=Cryphonectria parasitica (strain ATCC 38755 / EP155) TaxID=660469 RepID=A0A9P5CTJ2_CRYP1|nr:uncharacterized protein M406DRAFT_66814 [Cryphonectria parasitica EP155]KAF3770403.1 hypothetical protein M406DRAFT_66814 [Cryphonectria parasitica EP155]
MTTDTTTERPLVAFLGPPSSFTHQATKSAFPEAEYSHQPVGTIKDVFEAVQSGTTQLGVVPFENSTHGVVTFTLDSLADRRGAYGDLRVCGEVYLDVHHFLLGAELEPSLGHVRRVLSHPQALGQTDGFLTQHLAGVERVDVSSTSRAAELASQDTEGTTAAVAAEMAADMFGLDVLARHIEDRDDNTTRFFVLRRRKRRRRRRRRRSSSSSSSDEQEASEAPEKGYKSLVSFTVPHRSPGALAAVLDVFNKYGLNLTSINSLPSLIAPFQYLFFVEFEGSREHDPEGQVKSALDQVDKVAEGWRWLGSWERQR